jgi:hypothetical protein
MGLLKSLGRTRFNGRSLSLAMRFQTSFEKIAAATNGQLFGWSFIGLRVFLGVVLVFMTLNSGAVTYWNADAAFSSGDLLWSSATQVVMFAFGVSLILGLLIRPLAVAMLAYVVVSTVLVIQQGTPGVILFYIPVFLLLGMYVSGGAGHAFGLDGVVLRNIRRPNAITKFLFG